VIWALLILGLTNVATVMGWTIAAVLDSRERRILTSAALTAQGKTVAAAVAGKNTAAEDRAKAEQQARLARNARTLAAPFSAMNPFGR
jgi:hypothetical protein